MNKVIFVVGPTASGKTSFSISLAKKIGAEIVSADSMQIYKYMDIGTAKPNEAEMCGVPHHMLDVVYPDENFSVAQYHEMSLKCINSIFYNMKKVIVTGGTGLYINSLIYNISYSKDSVDLEYRKDLESIAAEYGNAHIHKMLREIDPEAANNIHPNDRKRIIRALEIFKTTGKNASAQIASSRENPPEFEYEVFGLDVERSVLYSRIDKRVDKMIESGLLEEVKMLIDKGYKSGTAMQAIGYKELVEYCEGKIGLEEAIYKIKIGTKHYAKRQMTWFRKIRGVKWLKM